MTDRPEWHGGARDALPHDASIATLLGRAWHPGHGGPVPVTVRERQVIDLGATFATVRDITEHDDPVEAVRASDGPSLGSVDELLANTPVERRDPTRPWLLSPIDLHVVKAAGVTFAVSLLERVIEERALGNADAAGDIRRDVEDIIGAQLSDLVPGSNEALRIKEVLIDRGLWSQYLEVGIGPDAEVFTKVPVLASVGSATDVGVRDDSDWNNPEPEVVLVVSSRGRVLGATLGNDVNLRDIEGRSALLLGQAKDNTGSASLGPFIRLLDSGFTAEDVRALTVSLRVEGEDGFVLTASSEMSKISRDPIELVTQVIGSRHQYPDGFVLYLGTMFAPSQDRDEEGHGFTHHSGDIVRIGSPALGMLVNRVRRTNEIEPWTFGLADLFASITRRRAGANTPAR